MTLSGTQGDHLRVLLQYAFDAVGEVEHLVRRGSCSDLQHAQETIEEYSHLIAAESRWVPQEVLDRHPSYTTFYALVETVEQKLAECQSVRATQPGLNGFQRSADVQGRVPRWIR